MNQLAIALVLVLFPGVIATIVGDKLTDHSEWNSFKFAVYSLVLGILSYVLLQLLVYASDIYNSIGPKPLTLTQLDVWSIAINDKSKITLWEIGTATILSLPVAFLASWTINFKIYNKIAQKLRVTNKYGDENLYSFYLNAKEIDWVYIRDIEANLTYQGRIVSYSENDKIQELVLSDVTIFRYADSEELYSVPSIYLSKKPGQFVIEAIPQNSLEETDEEEATD